jgi:hypothetical protein
MMKIRRNEATFNDGRRTLSRMHETVVEMCHGTSVFSRMLAVDVFPFCVNDHEFQWMINVTDFLLSHGWRDTFIHPDIVDAILPKWNEANHVESVCCHCEPCDKS